MLGYVSRFCYLALYLDGYIPGRLAKGGKRGCGEEVEEYIMAEE